MATETDCGGPSYSDRVIDKKLVLSYFWPNNLTRTNSNFLFHLILCPNRTETWSHSIYHGDLKSDKNPSLIGH